MKQFLLIILKFTKISLQKWTLLALKEAYLFLKQIHQKLKSNSVFYKQNNIDLLIFITFIFANNLLII